FRPASKRERRVRANAATISIARVAGAVVARAADALPPLFADELEVVDHTTGAVFDRDGELSSLRSLLRARDPTLASEPLATLGDSLALFRTSTSGSKFAGGAFDVGAYEMLHIDVIEVDAQGRLRRMEFFPTERLGDAVARLYERYAELLPDGSARARAAATARSVAALPGRPFDLDRYATALAPDVESVDHRTLGTWSARGAEALLQHYRSLLEVAPDVAMGEDDILGLRAAESLQRRSHLC